MSFQDRAVASANRLVQHFSGGSSLVVQSGAGTFSTVDRGVTPATTTMTVVCTFPTPYASRQVDGDRVRSTDLRVLVRADDPARTFPLRPDQVVTLSADGRQYRIVSVDPRPGADELQLRGVS